MLTLYRQLWLLLMLRHSFHLNLVNMAMMIFLIVIIFIAIIIIRDVNFGWLVKLTIMIFNEIIAIFFTIIIHLLNFFVMCSPWLLLSSLPLVLEF